MYQYLEITITATFLIYSCIFKTCLKIEERGMKINGMK